MVWTGICALPALKVMAAARMPRLRPAVIPATVPARAVRSSR
jgi:hypothetical protein